MPVTEAPFKNISDSICAKEKNEISIKRIIIKGSFYQQRCYIKNVL